MNAQKAKQLKYELIKFLREHGALDAFLVNLYTNQERRVIDYIQRRGNAYDLFYGAFHWSQTPEGIHYWSCLSDEWQDKCKKRKGNVLFET